MMEYLTIWLRTIAACATKIPTSTRLKMKPYQIATIYSTVPKSRTRRMHPMGRPVNSLPASPATRWKYIGGIFQFIVERDCTQCHTQGSSFELTVHHRTDLALGNLPQGPDCKACHGSLVDNMEDGHFISAEPTTAQTPKPKRGYRLALKQ